MDSRTGRFQTSQCLHCNEVFTLKASGSSPAVINTFMLVLSHTKDFQHHLHLHKLKAFDLTGIQFRLSCNENNVYPSKTFIELLYHPWL